MRHAGVFPQIGLFLFKNDRYQTVESALLSSNFATERLKKLLPKLLERWQTQLGRYLRLILLIFHRQPVSAIGNPFAAK